MKKIIVLSIVTAAIVAAAIIYSNKQKTPAPPAPVAETAPSQPEPQPQETVSIPNPRPAPAVTTPAAAPAIAAASAPNDAAAPTEETNSIRKTVDALLAARGEKREMLEQLRKDGQMEAVIAELQQRAAADPKNARIPTTLGEAQLAQVRTLHESGADEDRVGILAMQADQSFNTALKIDPKNWEAQFVKASTMFYWPPNEARDNDAAQRLASLIDQQETMPTQSPAFVQTYLALGNQYQKMGKMNEAMATWQLGLQKFPGDPSLQKKISGQ
jgi:tetratricopeptide (TPR) repeat protein